jgi:glycosyltransferase involved in cell wall biosynthesis
LNQLTVPDVAPLVGASDVKRRLTVVMPAFNEEAHVVDQVESVRGVMSATDWDFDIVVVDDGSTDDTSARAADTGVLVVRHRRNYGYGAALKRGISSTAAPWILIIDADGTYPVEAIPQLLAKAADNEMVVGARIGKTVKIPLLRRPAKWFLRVLASFLSGRKLPDINSGLRLMRRDLVERYQHLLPSGFSFTTTITLAAACNDHEVEYVPIDYMKRLGKSSIRPWHAYEFLLLTLRTIVFFNPLKVFMPLGAILAVAGLAKFIYDISRDDLSESAVLAFLAALVIWAVGLLADQNARIAMNR